VQLTPFVILRISSRSGEGAQTAQRIPRGARQLVADEQRGVGEEEPGPEQHDRSQRVGRLATLETRAVAEVGDVRDRQPGDAAGCDERAPDRRPPLGRLCGKTL
jgi:hypothetical protein